MAQIAADVPTMLVMIIIASMAMALSIAVVGWEKRRDGLGLWALALWLNAVAYGLYALRGQVPDLLSVLLANTLIACLSICMLAAVLQFQGRQCPWHLLWIPPLAMAAGMAIFPDHYGARVAVATLVLGAINTTALWALRSRRQTTAGRGAGLLTAILAWQLVVLVLRAAVLANDAFPASGMLHPSSIQTLTFMTTFAVVLVGSMGFVFMSKDRADENNRRMAAQDALTGVANRRTAIAALERDVARAIRTGESVAVMMVDVDHFKHINDCYGHPTGDQVLCSVVQTLASRLRAQDLVGRYGGEEFMVVLPHTDRSGAEQLAHQLCDAVAASRCSHEGHEIAVTASVGLFAGRLQVGDTWDMLIAAADRALYQAKEAGRNRVEVAQGLRRAGPGAPLQPADPSRHGNTATSSS